MPAEVDMDDVAQDHNQASLPVVDLTGQPQLGMKVRRNMLQWLQELQLQVSVDDEWAPVGLPESAACDAAWAETSMHDVCAQVRWLIRQAGAPSWSDDRPLIQLHERLLGAVVLLPNEDPKSISENGNGNGIGEDLGAYYATVWNGSSLHGKLMGDPELVANMLEVPSGDKGIEFPIVALYPEAIKSFCEKNKLDFEAVTRLVLLHEIGHHVFPLDDYAAYAKPVKEVVNAAEGCANLFAWMCSDERQRAVLSEKAGRQDSQYQVYKKLLEWASARYTSGPGKTWSPRVATLVDVPKMQESSSQAAFWLPGSVMRSPYELDTFDVNTLESGFLQSAFDAFPLPLTERVKDGVRAYTAKARALAVLRRL